MEQLNKDSVIKSGDIVRIKFKHLDSFTNMNVQRFGILRGEYDNKNSLSGCMDEMITIYNISGKIEEENNLRVFCWYIDGFKLLGGLIGNDYGNFNDNIDIFKLNEEETEKLQNFINNTKIADNLTD